MLAFLKIILHSFYDYGLVFVQYIAEIEMKPMKGIYTYGYCIYSRTMCKLVEIQNIVGEA